MQILKIGGSVITNKNGYMEANTDAISHFAEVIGRVRNQGMSDLILVHGAGSFGHPLVIKYKLNNGIKTEEQKQGYANTQESCSKLRSMLVEALLRNDVPAISIKTSEIIKQKNKRIIKFDEQAVLGHLEKGKVPVLSGDMVQDEDLGGSVCSGDQIVAYLGKNASRIILATNVDGVLANGKLVETISKSNLKDIEKHLASSNTPDVTGGMLGKIKELMTLSVPCYIVNGTKFERLEDILLGKKTVCTEIKA